MGGRVENDSFMEDSDDTCPLCVEEFDLSDRGFKPCPCGYQVCQFCYNNIKNNMNGLCPACRRPYDEKTIEWRIVSPEEFKADIAAQARRKAAARQKEAERRQVENLSRKHLQGLRVVQRNLVYITGMTSEGVPEEQLEEQLRGPSVFGQYGRIIKLAANKVKDVNGGNSSLAIFITFAEQDSASACIAALDGKPHQGRILKAQHGTTKYCQAYLRNEPCNNRNCTFLHETGEDSDSFSRQDLSSMNAASSQRPAPSGTSSLTRTTQSHPPQSQPLPKQQTDPVVAAVVQAVTSNNKAEIMSRSNSGDGSALPTTASWAKNPQIQQSRRSSQAASRATPSPKVVPAKPAIPRPDSRMSQSVGSSSVEARRETSQGEQPDQSKSKEKEKKTPVQAKTAAPSRADKAIKYFLDSPFKWSLDRSLYDEETLNIIDNYPSLIDPNGGAIRYAMRVQQEQERLKQAERQHNVLQAISTTEEEENLTSGSLQLGGEPDTSEDLNDAHGRRGISRQVLTHQPFGTNIGSPQLFDAQNSMANDFPGLNLMHRGPTPHQQRNISLLKSNHQPSDSMLEQFQRTTSNNTSQHQSQLSNPFQTQNQPLSNFSRHARQSSRFSFANDTSSASTTVKPVTNVQLLAQQAAMMPPSQNKQFPQPPHPQNIHANFYSGMQGPPPGLKSSGTPPISGGGMFGQGHGFASAMGGSIGFGGGHLTKNNNDDIMRDLLRGRAGTGNGLGPEAGKREFTFPSFLQKPSQSPLSAPGLSNLLQGSQLEASRGHIEQPTLKQKKKGKKHRHANTSPAGGGGIVDLADPSILQARMHHAGAGQGPYGGTQGQGGYNSHAMMYGGGFGGRW